MTLTGMVRRIRSYLIMWMAANCRLQIKMSCKNKCQALNKKFLYAADFAKAGFTEIFPRDELEKADVFTADYFSNAVLMNEGNLKFNLVRFPWQAQLSSYRDAVIVDANHDSLPDILLVGNFYENNIQMGRYDADFGTLLCKSW